MSGTVSEDGLPFEICVCKQSRIANNVSVCMTKPGAVVNLALQRQSLLFGSQASLSSLLSLYFKWGEKTKEKSQTTIVYRHLFHIPLGCWASCWRGACLGTYKRA